MSYTPIHISEDEILNRLPSKIGQVSLNYDCYSGKDLYSDGEIEDELLDIVKNVSRVEYRSVIEERKSWPVLYHLSDLRGNIVDFLPIKKTDKVLEIGSGCGAITDKLSDMAGEVHCVELSAKRSRINALRNQDKDNITIYVGNFTDIEPALNTDYDYICLIGAFEYASSYMSCEDPYAEFLKSILKHVKKDGNVAIAIENKFGLKYFAGCAEDHIGTFYSSLENYPEGGSARTFTRTGLEKIFRRCGVKEFSFYYPYPDYKFPSVIYSDERLPHKGELTNNIRNFDRHRMLTFRENLVFDSIIEEGSFPLFSNSYLAVLGKANAGIYAKYSNDRKSSHAIKTVLEKYNQDLIIKKLPCYPDSDAHIRDMEGFYELLKKRYEGSGFEINRCTLTKDENGRDTASFEYVKGVTLEELLDECVLKNDFGGFKRLFERFFELVRYNNGDVKITDYDMIFPNILVNKDRWTLIDYEWCIPEIIDPGQVAFRALYCYLLEDERRNTVNTEELLSIIGISPKEADELRDRELEFQKGVTENHKALGEILPLMGTYAIDVKELFERRLKEILNKRIQIYYDEGAGFSEDNSRYIPDVYVSDSTIDTNISFDGNVRALRIDPADMRCIVRINELTVNGVNVFDKKRAVVTNGKEVTNRTFVFDTEDPNINIMTDMLDIKGENTLHVNMELSPLSKELAEDISGAVKKRILHI